MKEEGILYLMKCPIFGLVKIGKTQCDRFDTRMAELEGNGYRNASGLKICYAIKTKNYSEKEKILHAVFARYRIANSELFSVDSELVIQLMSSLEGKQIYPKDETKKEIFHAAEEIRSFEIVPPKDFHLEVKQRNGKTIKAVLKKTDGRYFLLKGSSISTIPVEGKLTKAWIRARKSAAIKDGILQEDLLCSSPSMASSIVLSHVADGWELWKTSDNKPINEFRKSQLPDANSSDD